METYQVTLTTEAIREGRYHNRKFQKTELPRLQAGRTDVLQVLGVTTVLEQQGFVLNPSLDNKSIYEPAKLFDKLDKYCTPRSWKPRWAEFDLAWKCTKAAFAKPESLGYLTPLSLKEVGLVAHMAKSAGAPDYVKKADSLTASTLRAERIRKGLRKPDPCTSYHRIQHGDLGPKLRLVWGYPFSMTLLEGQFAAPLISTYLKMRTPMAFGLTKISVAAKIGRIRMQNFQYCFDFSGFDSSIHPRLIERAFSILRTWFEPSAEVDQLFKLIMDYFIHTPIVMVDGFIYRKRRGVPSGSWFTQLIDSIVNYFAIQYTMINVIGHPVNRESLVVLGDDSLLGLSHRVSIPKVASLLAEIGLTLNPEKTVVSVEGKGTHFLGHTWDHSLPHRELRDVAIRMAFPEKWDRTCKATNYARSRMVAFASDCVEAWDIIRHVKPFDYPNKIGAACSADKPLSVTGWQLYMRAVFGRLDDLSVMQMRNPGVFFHGPIS